ncbi:MAG: hypothetical protein H0T46_23485 [Deltaproteobacteria bacterium]|nr:hypothetical protein [Deltaproteobacteria bacterium]
MRIALVACALALAGCPGTKTASHSTPPAVAKGFPATRWVPANPTYVLASPTVREAQRSLRDVIDSLGVIAGVEAGEISRELGRLIAVDPLSPDALVNMGIDIEGGFVVFSEDVSPTFVAHLSAPDAAAAFFDRQRERGLVTQSVIVDGTELFTAALPGTTVKVSWAIAADWLWVHFALPIGNEDATSWFTSSHRPEGPGWSKDWQWASKASDGLKPALVGFLDPKDLIASFTRKVPDAIACARLLDPVSRVAIAIEGDGKHAAGRLTLEIGAAASSVTAAILPQPEGFGAIAAKAPLAAQWNVDLLTLRAWLQPCLASIDGDLKFLDRYGVRSARAVLVALDPDQKTGEGAVALDLAHKRYFASKLDDVPARSLMERRRTFGPHKGHSLSVPFVASVDYVLTDSLAMAGVGDGLLARVVGSGATVRGPLAAIDVVPPALSADAWKMLLSALDVGRVDRIVDRLMRWRDGHVMLTIEGSSLVLSAGGNRR